ncbi:MAG: response regulator transcription factor [Cyanobacteria bacterium]|jgi:two-component system, OmpR family, phosphate regulon response regulator PhoB|nr:response regulator transcription factor [Cyanobacteriota bacterium]
MKPTILVVDDEHDLVNLLRYNLQKEGYEVIPAYDGSTAVDLIWEKMPDLIVLDLMLPDRSGFDICRQIKAEEKTRKIPIIMLTARSSEHDRVSGFEAGAEDYVVKPFSPKELVLRVKAMLGRTRQSLPNILHIGRMTAYPDEYRVFIDNQEIPLTNIEFKILMSLARHPNVVKTREQLLEDVWREGSTHILDRAVDAHVKRLRAKMGEERDCIETVRGVGYRLSNQAPKVLSEV